MILYYLLVYWEQSPWSSCVRRICLEAGLGLLADWTNWLYLLWGWGTWGGFCDSSVSFECSTLSVFALFLDLEDSFWNFIS